MGLAYAQTQRITHYEFRITKQDGETCSAKRTHGRCKRNAAKGLGWKWGGAERAKCEGRKGIPEKSKSRNVQSPIAGGFQGLRIQGFEEMRNGEWGMGNGEWGLPIRNPQSAIVRERAVIEPLQCKRSIPSRAVRIVSTEACEPCSFRTGSRLSGPYSLLVIGYWLLRLRSMAAPRRSSPWYAVGRISAAAFQAGRGSPVRRPGRASESGLWAPRSYA